MKSEWHKVPLRELVGYISKGIAPIYSEKSTGTTISVLNQKCNRNFQISYAEARLHNMTQKKVPVERLIRKDDILINSTGTGTAGRVAQIRSVPCRTTVDGHMIILRANEKVMQRYLGYAIKAHQSEILQLDEGSTGQTELNRERLLDEIMICYPESIIVQEKIVTIFECIDQKIVVNKKINDNLEQQAVTYFQELYINNANPMWQIGTISDLGTVVGGSTPSKTKPEYYTNNGIAWITPKDLSINKSKFISHGENDITELGLKNSSATVMPKGTVLFSSRAPIGYIAIASNEVTTNQGFKSVVPYLEIGTAFVYFFLKHSLPVIESAASGSTFKEISGSAMKNIPAIIPDRSTLDQFNSFCAPIFAQQKILEDQNYSLAMLRDSLLPKLMSGAIDIASIQL
jgi:type I restriction enzyme S subunit